MMYLSSFLTLVDLYCAAAGVAEATLSSRLFNDGKRVTQIRQGADIGVRRMDKALLWLSINWPKQTGWPEEINRPYVDIPEAAE